MTVISLKHCDARYFHASEIAWNCAGKKCNTAISAVYATELFTRGTCTRMFSKRLCLPPGNII